jgi:hypothetical protein
LLWEERRRLGIPDETHDKLLNQLLLQWKKQGKKIDIQRFSKPEARGKTADES